MTVSTLDSLPQPLKDRLRSVKLLLLDVDGVLTDGGLYFANGGDEWKRFDVKDGAGIFMARKLGIEVGLITGKTSDIVARRAEELGMVLVRQGAMDKVPAFGDLVREAGRSAAETAYVGDEVLDLPVMARAGVSACPADAHALVRKHADLVLSARGGHGAVREFVDLLLEARGGLEKIERMFWEGRPNA
jgi:3-deoxy-D-manno-octulosonate 8-phosphate phosphatase (KDO 8-P phosphatase)